MKNTTSYLILIFSVILTGLMSCGGNLNNNKYSESEEVLEELPEGYYLGKAVQYVGKNKAESNLISQINTYNKALSRGGIDGASVFMYPDVIKYFKKYYNEDISNSDVIRNVLGYLSNMMIEAETKTEKLGGEVEFIVCEIKRTIKTDNAILCVFAPTIQYYYPNKVEKYLSISPAEDEYNLGISFNEGKNWYFMSINEDAPNILRERFDQSVINQIMNY